MHASDIRCTRTHRLLTNAPGAARHIGCMNTHLPFVIEEDVQAYVDAQDSAGRRGRDALQRLLESGCLGDQSASLALCWLAQHPQQPERRRMRGVLRGLVGRRVGEANERRPFLLSMVGMGALLAAIMVFTPYMRNQTSFSPMDGGFNTPSAEMLRSAASS